MEDIKFKKVSGTAEGYMGLQCLSFLFLCIPVKQKSSFRPLAREHDIRSIQKTERKNT